jgi:hypothetical protein
MMSGCSAMTAATSRMTPPSFFPARQYVIAYLCHNERGSFKKITNDARMLLKTKERCGKLAVEAGMSMKTNGLSADCGNVVENTGS